MLKINKLAFGKTITLTTDEDNLIGTSGNDTFTATSSTLTADDKITDGSMTDKDVLNIAASGTLDPLDITNVETINIDWQRLSSATIDLENVSGATVSLTSARASFTGNVTFNNTGTNNISVGAGVDGTLTVDAIEDASIAATVADTVTVTNVDGDVTINAGAAETISVAGAPDTVTLTALSADDITVGGAWDEATLTLGVDADVALTGATDGIATINSDSDIEITIEASTFEELTFGGSGTINAIFDDIADLDGLTVSNAGGTIEIASVSTADLSLVSAEEIIFASGADADLTVADGISIGFDEAVTGTFNFLVSEDEDSGSNSINVSLGGTGAYSVSFDSDVDQDFEDVTITIEPGAAFDTDDNYVINEVNSTATAATELTFISTDEDVNVVVSSLNAAELDASGVAGAFSFTQDSAREIVVIGAAGGGTATFVATTQDVEFTNAGDGDNVISLATTTGSVYINLAGGDNTINQAGALAGGSFDITSGDGDDTLNLTGGTGDVTFALGGGDDTLVLGASAGNLTIDGSLGAGDDSLTFETGDSAAGTIAIDFGAGDDTVTFGTADFRDADITFTGLETIVVTSADTVFLDSLVLDGKGYTLEDNGDAGGAATATIDVLIQTGADSFDGSSLVISENISNAFLGLDITTSNGGDDTTIIGTTGSDRIRGLGGDDTITGGEGADTMTGDSGADTFIFTEDDSGITSATYDSISDWTVADDLIDFGGIAGGVGNYDERLATGAAVASAIASVETAFAANTDLEFYFVTNGTDGFIMWDTDGDQTVDVVVRLVGANALTSFSAANLVDSGG